MFTRYVLSFLFFFVFCHCYYRNIIKFDLISRTMSLQPPAVFSAARDVVYVSEYKGMTLFLYMYSVSQKNIPDIFSCNSKKHYRIFIIFGSHITEKVDNQQII